MTPPRASVPGLTTGGKLLGRCEECGMVEGWKEHRVCLAAIGGVGVARSMAAEREKGFGKGLRTGNLAGADARPPQFVKGKR